MNKYCMIEIAFNNQAEALEVANILLSRKLVASTHIFSASSSWNWENKRECDKEYLLQVKTKAEVQKDIYEVVKKVHRYECFEFAVYYIDSINTDYLNWIDRNVMNDDCN